MKQAVNFGGDVIIIEVPAPVCGSNEILVQNICSVISPGTEGSSIRSSTKGVLGLIDKAKNNPEMLQKVILMVKNQGLQKTLNVMRDQAEGSLSQLGYSCSGIVLAVGKNVRDISVGDKVACAGAGYANHAEIVAVPRNLSVKIPIGVSFGEAAFTTLGAIALQGIRRAQIQLGDRVAVMGLGLLGQIACQILKASGTFVIGIDPIKERLDLVKEFGIDVELGDTASMVSQVNDLTGGIGVDAVIVYASSASSKPVQQAMQMTRKKGKVIVVGAVGMELSRSPFYEKELDFMISCSYGPGRYDTLYEEKGIDYPIGYVRWTENRNMQAFLELISNKRVNVNKLISKEFNIEQASEAYQSLNISNNKPIGIIFKYKTYESPFNETHTINLKPLVKTSAKINVAVIGAGSFAQGYHLPNLQKLPFFNIRAIVTRTGTNARKIAEKYGAQYCSTDYKDVLKDNDIDMVLIATRHSLHAQMISEFAQAGKQIFIEKPIAINYEQCKEVYDAINNSGVNLSIGFNRRFSPLSQRVKRLTEKRKGPMIITYRVNSASMKTEHWINDPEEGGSAIVGEGCHFYDFINWLIGYEPRKIYAEMISATNVINTNNIVSTLKYEDGSIASIVYTTIGDESFPKERIEIFFDGIILIIDDYKTLTIAGGREKGINLHKTEKGQFELLQEYGKFLRGKSISMDIPDVLDGIKATICSLKTLDCLRTGKIQDFNYPW